MKYPEIYLAIDNCFALKRWVEPETWGKLCKDMGYSSIQASFDNEMDMLFTTPEYRENWILSCKALEKEPGISVKSLYTGYQTYRTSGLCHPKESEVSHLVSHWIKPAIDTAQALGCDMGFSIHCLTEEQMADPELYKETHEKLYKIYSDIGAYAKEHGKVQVCVEAMYVPRQTPWTIEGTKEFLKNIYAIDKNPVYTTVDVGHMTGQRKFRKPSKEKIIKSMEQADKQTIHCELWLGTERAYDLWEQAVKKSQNFERAAEEIIKEIENHPYQFSVDERDDDLYAWTEELACYSPIMHLQQTNGTAASHQPFTEKNNEKGIVDGKKLLEAIAKSYEKEIPGMPEKTDRIVLGLELFASNTDFPRDIIMNMKETCKYWRKYIPKDGMRLDELLERLK